MAWQEEASAAERAEQERIAKIHASMDEAAKAAETAEAAAAEQAAKDQVSRDMRGDAC